MSSASLLYTAAFASAISRHGSRFNLAARKGGGEQNLRLGLPRADLRDEACVTSDELGLAVADVGLECAISRPREPEPTCSTTSFA